MKWSDLVYFIKSDRIVLLTALLFGLLFVFMVYLTSEGFDQSTAIVGDSATTILATHIATIRCPLLRPVCLILTPIQPTAANFLP